MKRDDEGRGKDRDSDGLIVQRLSYLSWEVRGR